MFGIRHLAFRSAAMLSCLLISIGCGTTAPSDLRITAAATAPASQPAGIELLAMGDWGEDTAAQRAVAAAMVTEVQAQHIDPVAMLLLGDNFYFKLSGAGDPRWQTVFERVYDRNVLSEPFYACLGNHDYDGNNLQAELGYAKQNPQSRFKLPAEWYRIDLPPNHPMVTVLMLDSNKDNMNDADWHRQVAWLEKQLAGPRAAWTICCAHHPLFSNGFFWGNGILQKDWGTLFQKYHVDFYLCGHEHDMEHLEIPGWTTSFVVAGGGGAHRHPLSRDDRGFSREAFGFVELELTQDQATVRMIGDDDKPMHVFVRAKSGRVQVIETTPNTPRTNPLKAYLEMKPRQP